MDRINYRVSAVFDTETTNYGADANMSAFPILYIFNDIRNVSLRAYDYGHDSTIRFYRTSEQAYNFLDSLIIDGINHGYVPIVCAYNLMFDMQTLMHRLASDYTMRATAQSATHVYTLDVMLDDKPVLRFWDTFFLEMNGLRAMGETCGLPKAVGDWDYTLIRTQDTPLSERELYYAGRDTEVIPAYLRWILETNKWAKETDFGTKILTKTSLVRQMAKHDIGNLKLTLSNGKKETLNRAFMLTCKQEFPKDYRSYALRKACFRGGLTFTSARFASVPVQNVASLDVTSMHHTFINGRKLPVKFRPIPNEILQVRCNEIANISMHDVLKNYGDPFRYGLHAQIRFMNLRLKRDSCFERWGIGIIPRSKFTKKVSPKTDYSNNERSKISEEDVRDRGFLDTALHAIFAFGKLYSCDECILNLCEIELWNIAQVYDYDRMEVLYGEGSCRSIIPPDYVTLQSNILFDMKTNIKNLIKHYRAGTELVDWDIPKSVPIGLADEARGGTLDEHFLQSYYSSSVKGQFNGIYGTQAQDVLKPEYAVDENGELYVDKATMTTPENFKQRKPKKPKVLYTYGLRIVAGSRMHLIIGMMLLDVSLGDRVDVTGGDTDSLKIRCDDDVTDDDLIAALQPLHDAATNAIHMTQYRLRKNYPDLVSPLTHIGCFDVESCGSTTRYKWHMEAWNKARMSVGEDDVAHITCAGLPRPSGVVTVVDMVQWLMKHEIPFTKFAPLILGYDTFVNYNLAHTLQRTSPDVSDVFDGDVTDYHGATKHVHEYMAIGLYPCGRWLGESDKQSNEENIRYLKRQYDRNVTVGMHELRLNGNTPEIVSMIDEAPIL